MPFFLETWKNRGIFAEKMEEKRDFKSITRIIKKECLSFGCGWIKFDKDKEDLWIDDYENYLSASVHVDSINIDYNVITLYEDGHDVLTFDYIFSIDRQIQIYDTIYDHQGQLHYFELDWDDYFKALQVKNRSNKCIWRILTKDEALHLWYNSKCDIFQLFNDGTECIDNEEHLNDCLKNGFDIGVPI